MKKNEMIFKQEYQQYAICIEDLSFSYGEKEDVSLSLKIKKGEKVCLLGHNGSGKSTLLKLIDGLLVPKSGNIYINGYLKLVSKELPEFDFRALNDSYDKQESVPYNISLGGGTQGLIDALTPDKTMPFSLLSTLEENFCGTFIGDMRSFKIYNEPLEYHEIKNNYLFEMKQSSIKTNKIIKNSLVYYGFGFLEEDIIESGNTIPANKNAYTRFNCTSNEDRERFFYIVSKDYIGAIAQEFTVGGAPMVTNIEEKQIFKKDCIVYSSVEEYPKNTSMTIITSNF